MQLARLVAFSHAGRDAAAICVDVILGPCSYLQTVSADVRCFLNGPNTAMSATWSRCVVLAGRLSSRMLLATHLNSHDT